ncbi:MAG: EscR/YscR/HrcR family type III secretion system export apparatus protein [Proteobacteria bacterium]|nr:EscR/YscR/HrcR family type III secretion system export apparatus protein [Pseudomonadota bacterium]
MNGNPLYLFSGMGISFFLVVSIIFFALLFSSFVKISTILSIVKVGFGVDSVPSAIVTTLVSLALSFFIIAPVISNSMQAIDHSLKSKPQATEREKTEAILSGFESWKTFVIKFAKEEEKNKFARLSLKIDKLNESAITPEEFENVKNSWRVLAPAFVISELKSAFKTGFSLFLPLLVIDLLTSTVLVAIGFEKINPYIVALPLKILLFILLDGWSIISSNLVSSYF